MKSLGLISCTKSKQNYPCKASEMYLASDLFRKAYSYATRNYDFVAILSAKYGLLFPDDKIEPYDLTLNNMNVRKRKEWAEKVFKQMKTRLNLEDFTNAFFHAGKRYREHLIPKLENLGIRCKVPLEHFGIGEQMAWYRVQGHQMSVKPTYPGVYVEEIPRLAELAQQIIPKVKFEDLVLPKREKKLLHDIVTHVTQRPKVYKKWDIGQISDTGLGISALFVGPSGTGKTMAAEVLANELNLPLYRIDLSAVVSKYIGETEKNLDQLFDGAEEIGAILFFDEADALFGKRSEVRDSHERYANIEINYLLQRMESYKGLAILATNIKNAIDPAFMRRIRFVVNFPFPDEREL